MGKFLVTMYPAAVSTGLLLRFVFAMGDLPLCLLHEAVFGR